VGQTVEQCPRVRNIEDRLGQKGTGHAGAIMGRPAAAPIGGHETVQLQQRQRPHKSLVEIAHGAEFLGQDGKELALKKLRKSAEESSYAIHGGRRVQSKFCSSQIFYCLASPPTTFPLSFVLYRHHRPGAPDPEFCKYLAS
jgi:hypothetical protein